MKVRVAMKATNLPQSPIFHILSHPSFKNWPNISQNLAIHICKLSHPYLKAQPPISENLRLPLISQNLAIHFRDHCHLSSRTQPSLSENKAIHLRMLSLISQNLANHITEIAAVSENLKTRIKNKSALLRIFFQEILKAFACGLAAQRGFLSSLL